MSGDYVLAGYLRFIQSDEPGVIAQVISVYKDHHADDSDVPIYRRQGETKGNRQLDGTGVLGDE